MVREGGFEQLKGRFRVLYRKCESNKETVKLMGLAKVSTKFDVMKSGRVSGAEHENMKNAK